MADQNASDELSWQLIGKYKDLNKKRCQRLYAESGKADDLVLLCAGNRFYAMDNWCGHAGGPLSGGDIEDYNGRPHVMCPWHAFMFDAETGKNELGIKQEVFQTKVKEGELFILYKSPLSRTPYTA